MFPDEGNRHSIKLTFLRVGAIVGSILLFTGGPDEFSRRSVHHAWDAGHVIFFAILSTIILSQWSKKESMTYIQKCTLAFLISLFLGIVIELAQIGTKRTADILDVLRDVVGVMFAVSFLYPPDKNLRKSHFLCLQTLTVLCLVWVLFPFFKATVDEFLAHKQFPVLCDFETPFEIDRWRGDALLSIDHNKFSHGRSSLKAVLNTTAYSGVRLKYFPGDWRAYKYFSVSIFNSAGMPLKITCRIHDGLHARTKQAYDDRFNRTYLLSFGWNHITIPLDQVLESPRDRYMDMRLIQEFGIFTSHQPVQRTIYIDNVHLSNQKGQPGGS